MESSQFAIVSMWLPYVLVAIFGIAHLFLSFNIDDIENWLRRVLILNILVNVAFQIFLLTLISWNMTLVWMFMSVGAICFLSPAIVTIVLVEFDSDDLADGGGILTTAWSQPFFSVHLVALLPEGIHTLLALT